MRDNRAEISAHRTKGTNEWAFSYMEQPARHAGLKWGLGSMRGDVGTGQIAEVMAILDRLVTAVGKKAVEPEMTLAMSFNVEEREET